MATYIANIICQAIEKVGSENVVLIIDTTMYKSVGNFIKIIIFITFIMTTQFMDSYCPWKHRKNKNRLIKISKKANLT